MTDTKRQRWVGLGVPVLLVVLYLGAVGPVLIALGLQVRERDSQPLLGWLGLGWR